MMWWRSFRHSSQVRCKYVDSSTRVKVYSNFDGVVEELQTLKSERKIKGKERVSRTPEVQIATSI
jgi:hypothetical protein